MSDWTEAERHAQRAQQFYEAGQWDKALDELRQALQYNPFQSEWYYGLGLTLDALSRFGEAAQAFEHVISLRGDDLETLLRLGVDLVRCEQPQRAIESFERAQQLERDCEASYCHRIHAYSQLGDHDAAELMFYLARQLVDECPTCYDGLAHSLAERGQYDRAVWCWQQTLRLDPIYPDAHANLALSHWRMGQHERARQDFIRQLRQQPFDVRSLLELGNLLVEMHREPEAAEKFRRALELDPTRADAHYYLGELALLSGHLDLAESRFLQARQLDTNRPGVQLGLARVARQRGQLKEARIHARAETHRAGQTPEQAMELARQLIDLDMPDTAVELLTPLLDRRFGKTLKAEAQMAAIRLLRGTAELARGRTAPGVQDLRRALRHMPTNLTAMQKLVAAHLSQGELHRAGVWLRRARRLAPGDAELRRLRLRLWRLRAIRTWRRWCAA